MARLTDSQLAGFRIGTTTSTDTSTRRARESDKPAREPGTEQPPLALDDRVTSTSTVLGQVPPAPARSDARQKIGLTLPAELAAEVRGFIQQGYALADLVMVAYRHHRDDLVREHTTRTARQLERRRIGRGSFTITLSAQERDALDDLARHLDATRSHTVAALIERHLPLADTSMDTPPPPEPRSDP